MSRIKYNPETDRLTIRVSEDCFFDIVEYLTESRVPFTCYHSGNSDYLFFIENLTDFIPYETKENAKRSQ